MATQPIVPEVILEASLGNAINDVAGTVINDVAGRPILDMGLTDILGETRTTAPISMREGIEGTGPLDRVGDVGEISFRLGNTGQDYSPDSANVRDRFRNGPQIRHGLSHAGNASYKRAYIASIDPDDGQYGPKGTHITAYDWLDKAAEDHPKRIPVQLGQRDDQLIQTALDNASRAPMATSLAIGPDTYPYAFHNFQDENAKMIGVMQAIAQSGMGYIILRGNAIKGEELVYQTRIDRLEEDTPVATLSDSMQSVNVIRNKDNRVRSVTVFATPTRVDAAATTVLYEHTSEISLAPGQSKSFDAYYVDPTGQGARVAMVEPVQPVAGTDFEFSSTSGSGSDLNDDLGVTVVHGGNAARVTVKNNAGVQGFVQVGFQLRGKGVYIYDRESVTEVADGVNSGRELSFVMPYNDSLDRAGDIAQFILNQWSEDFSTVEGVRFVANRTEALMAAAINTVPGNLVHLEETQTGLDNDFYCNMRSWEIYAGGRFIPVEWAVTPAVSAQVWRLDSTVLSVLDSTTIPAP
ncbi:MAG: hypothetical protein DWQ07_14185 [Chloroflexi bacterium]|nr:MAG: hypothetical protein DWQ07_14185 [Chloroflexota bacterium]